MPPHETTLRLLGDAFRGLGWLRLGPVTPKLRFSLVLYAIALGALISIGVSVRAVDQERASSDGTPRAIPSAALEDAYPAQTLDCAPSALAPWFGRQLSMPPVPAKKSLYDHE